MHIWSSTIYANTTVCTPYVARVYMCSRSLYRFCEVRNKHSGLTKSNRRHQQCSQCVRIRRNRQSPTKQSIIAPFAYVCECVWKCVAFSLYYIWPYNSFSRRAKTLLLFLWVFNQDACASVIFYVPVHVRFERVFAVCVFCYSGFHSEAITSTQLHEHNADKR